MKFNNRPSEPNKTVDGKTIWNSRSPAVCSTIVALGKIGDVSVEDTHILASKRGRGLPNHVGKWNLACGYLDWDEDGSEGARRELWEETGINIDELMDTYKSFNKMDKEWDVNSNPNTDELQNITLHYGAIILLDGDPLPETSSENAEENEIEEIKWIPTNAVKDYDWAFNHDNRIKKFINYFIKDRI